MKQIRRWTPLLALVLLFAGCKAGMPQAPAGEPADCSESFPLAKYGIRLEAGETYRVGLSDHQSNGGIFSEEFTVEG